MAETMGILGPAGTHSEAAALYLNRRLKEPRRLVIYSDIYDVLQAVTEHEVDEALVPVENSLEGAINITLDVLACSTMLSVERELIWPVHNLLMAKCQPAEVRRIYSHSQPISQCRVLLEAQYPDVEIVKVASTARAAEIVGDLPAADGAAAICTARGGELNGLKLLAADVQDNMANSTRFYQLRPRQTLPPGRSPEQPDRELIICQIAGQKAGALCEVLMEFARRNVNLTRIESRPARTELGEYIFFFDLECEPGREQIREDAIAAVAQRCIWLKNLGAFPVWQA